MRILQVCVLNSKCINPQRMRKGYSSRVGLFVCLSVPSTLEPVAIRTLQLQPQQCLDATLEFSHLARIQR